MMVSDFKKRVQDKLELATVKVSTTTGFKGTGFFITPDGYILTAWHCIEEVIRFGPLSHITIEHNGKKFEDAQLDEEKSIKARDIAIIKINHHLENCVPLGRVAELHKGDDVISVAYPAGHIKGKDKIGVYPGTISRFSDDNDTVEIIGIQGRGHSGGLIYHYTSKRVIGMVTDLYKKDVMINAGLAVKFDCLLGKRWLEVNDEVSRVWDEYSNPHINIHNSQPQDYEYDIFLSYKPYGYVQSWVHNIFKPALELYLEHQLGRFPNIVTAKQKKSDILPKYSNKLAYSRCLIPIWSPEYLKLPWSYYEYSIFKQRTQQNYHKLILPVGIIDGHTFHQYRFTHNLDEFKCQKYFRDPIILKQTSKYRKLHDEIAEEWIHKVVEAINSVPPWESHWPEEVRIIANNFEHEKPNIKIQQPKMF